MKGIHTYVSLEHLMEIVEIFDITTYSANEASHQAFNKWRSHYDKDWKHSNESSIDDFDIISQVNMFDHDLTQLYKVEK